MNGYIEKEDKVCWGVDVAQPLGEAWYCGFMVKGTKSTEDEPRQYLVNLDTMQLVKCASTLQELWSLEGWAAWDLQANIFAKGVVMQGPFAIILDQQEEEARDFTCHVSKLGRPVLS